MFFDAKFASRVGKGQRAQALPSLELYFGPTESQAFLGSAGINWSSPNAGTLIDLQRGGGSRSLVSSMCKPNTSPERAKLAVKKLLVGPLASGVSG